MTRFRIDLRGGAFRSVFSFVGQHWSRQPWRISGIFGAMLLATMVDVLTPFFAGRLVDAIASGTATEVGARHSAIAAFGALVVLGIAALVFRQATFTMIVSLTLRMMRDMAADGFHRVQRFSTDWHANTFAGSTVRKITRAIWALDLFNDTVLVALFPAFVMLTGSTLLMGYFWPLMGVVIAVGSVLFIGLAATLSLTYVAPAASLANAWDTKLGGALADAVSCNAVVKGFGAEEREDQRLGGVLDKWQRRTRRTWKRGNINGLSQGIALLSLRTAVIGTALWLWIDGQATAGDLTFVLTSFFLLQGYLRDVGVEIRHLQRAVNDMEELADIMRHPLGIEDRAGAKPIQVVDGEIAFDRVTFHYGNHREPLYRDFSVTVPAGQRVGLVGHSGSGKTTFVKLIQRLYDLKDGCILIDGQDIADATQASLRQQIAIVQQEPILFHRSLAENIAYARPGASQSEIEEAAKLANAHDFIADLPKGYATLVGERGVKLSGGERQRVAIARAFLADAPILILDEATSSLDSESEVLIQNAMERLMQGRTTLVIAHRLSTVRALDRLLVFDKGRIAEEGSHEQLIRRPGGIYRRLFERQALELTKGLAV
jgi:ATP-binding cassette subfamily B protein